MATDVQSPPLTGLLVAIVIIALWLSSLGLLLFVNIDRYAALWAIAAILGRMFIQTGLFIVAHDAIHGTLLPSLGASDPVANRRYNHSVGKLAVALYALLPYQKLVVNHWRHHRHPGQAGDPDFHDGVHCGLFPWYLKFMCGYLDRRQQVVLFFGIGAIFWTLHLGFHIALANLLLFWILPILLSSMQLFFFGTYLPHRFSTGNSDSAHHIASNNYLPIFSFLTCYHFGYHWEHHEYPALPWYALPWARQLKN
jgi:beta-carotene/zeaxanthin 4-ketolase